VVVVFALGIVGMWFPRGLYHKIRDLFARLPLPVQIALVIFVFLLVFKVSTAASVPFVYERV
ncbi:MAG: hypothetical protein ACTSXZ_05935, partial [Alphaproteobacteria bacterium]